MSSSVLVADLVKKRKHEESSNDAVFKHSDCESDSDSDFACEVPEGGNTCSTVLGDRLQSGIRPFTSSTAYVSPTKEAASNGAAQKSLASNNTPICSNLVPSVSVDESESESDGEGEEAAEVEEVQPTISCASVTLSSDTNRSITKPVPSPGLTSSLKTDVSTVKASNPQSRMVNTNSDLAHVRNLGNESDKQPNNTKYSPFHPLYNFTSPLSRHFNPTPPPTHSPPHPPPLMLARPPPPRPPPFNFYMPSPSPFPPFRPFPPFLNFPPPFPHPPFPPPPHLNNMPFPSPPPY